MDNIDNLTNEQQQELFLSILLSGTQHDIELRAVSMNKAVGVAGQHFSRDFKKFRKFIEKNNMHNLFFGVYTREGQKGDKEHVRESVCLFADQDFKDYAGGEEEATEILKKFPIKPTIIINSGNGYHLYWILIQPIDVQALRDKIEGILKGIAVALLADMSTTEIARVLRVPETLNYKYDPPRPIKIIRWGDERYTLDHFESYCKQSAPTKKPVSNVSVDNLIGRCNFIKYCRDNAKDLPEPLWYAMISNVSRLTGGPELCHSLSADYPNYTSAEVDKKIIHALNAGPHTCQWIKDNGFVCTAKCNVKSPTVVLQRNNEQDQIENLADVEKQKTPTQSEILLDIASTLQLFHDQHREPFCYFQNQILPLKSHKVKESLGYQFYTQTGKAPNSDALNQAITVLKGKALFEGKKVELHNRVAVADGVVWYDMGDGAAIKIKPGQWELTDKVPALFRRYTHQQKQVIPQKGGCPTEVFSFLNIDKDHQLLVLVYIVSCFIPGIPHPIFHPHGPQGSGKTTFCRILKDLIDPSSLSTLIMQRDYAQLIQAIAHHHFVPFDNLSDLPGWASDILAIACTGGGLSKRQLFTDEDDIVLSVRRCIGINAINLLISRADLMDRAILLHLHRIDPSKRRDETQFYIDFEQQKAVILGGIFDTLARAMELYPSVNLERLPRMADFAKWGYAIGETLQRNGGNAFLEAYQDNIKRQNEEIIQSNTLILAVLKLMNEKTECIGTIKSIFNKLFEIANPNKNDPSFPKAERNLRKHLERAQTTLAQKGINFTIGQRTAEGIPISFSRSDIQEDTATSTLHTLSTQTGGANVDNEANVDNFPSSCNDAFDIELSDIQVKQ